MRQQINTIEQKQMQSSISSVPPAETPTYHSDRERVLAILMQTAVSLTEGLEVSEYSEHMLRGLRAGLTKDEAHERAIGKSTLVRDSKFPPRR